MSDKKLFFEYSIIKAKCKLLALDDINTFKCKKISDELRLSSEWEILYESHERNGFMVCKNIIKNY